MKTITSHIPALLALIFLASCSSIRLNDFARARYTKYGHSDPVVQFNKINREDTKVANQNITEDKPVINVSNVPAPIIAAKTETQPIVSKLVKEHKKRQVVNAQPVSKNSKVNSEVSKESIVNATPENVKAATSVEEGHTSIDPILYILLAIFVSPLAVYLYDGNATTRFWVVLILWLLGIGIGFAVPFAFLLWLAAVIYAVIIVTGS